MLCLVKRNLFQDEVAEQWASLQGQYVPIVDTAAPVDDPTACLLCAYNERRYAPLPCGHLCICASCTNTHWQGRWGVLGQRLPIICPVCRAVVTGSNKFISRCLGSFKIQSMYCIYIVNIGYHYNCAFLPLFLS